MKHYEQAKMILTQNGSKYVTEKTLACHAMMHVAHVERYMLTPS